MSHSAARHRPATFTKLSTIAALAAAAALASAPARAAEPQGLGIYLEAGQSLESNGRDSTTGTIGLRVPTQTTFWGGSLSLAFDFYVSQWKTDELAGARSHFTQVGVVPMLRYRFGAGQSPWFVDGGIGVSYIDGHARRGTQEFSTEWNFSDHLGVGRNFGVDNRHELGVYVKHVSNAGFKRPNPGETFYQLRYGYRF